jgi:hypothetical protein
MLPPHNCNLMTRMWQLFEFNTILNHCSLEWFFLVKLCMVMVLGSVEDEHVFSNLSFLKSKLQNHLTTHLNLIVWMYVQSFYNLESFHFYIVICEAQLQYGFNV